jgi:AraC family transcriptional regulator, chitin signaling transcriptional activator
MDMKRLPNNSQSEEQSSWARFADRFAALHPTFLPSLLRLYPSLTDAEVRVCMVIRAALDSGESQRLLQIAGRTWESHRSAIRRKLKLAPSEKILNHLVAI